MRFLRFSAKISAFVYVLRISTLFCAFLRICCAFFGSLRFLALLCVVLTSRSAFLKVFIEMAFAVAVAIGVVIIIVAKGAGVLYLLQCYKDYRKS